MWTQKQNKTKQNKQTKKKKKKNALRSNIRVWNQFKGSQLDAFSP